MASPLIQGPSIWVRCLHQTLANTIVTFDDMNAALPTAAEGFEIVSSDNTNDKAAGTGALTMGIEYLDIAGAWHSDTLTLNGTTAVVSANSDYWRINDAYIITTGSSGSNVGAITGRKVSAGGNRFTIQATRNRAALGKFTVPAGYEFIFMGAQFSTSVITGALTPLKLVAVIEAEMNPRDRTYSAGVFTEICRGTNGLGRPIDLKPPTNNFIKIPALATIRARGSTETATTCEVAGSFWGVLSPV